MASAISEEHVLFTQKEWCKTGDEPLFRGGMKLIHGISELIGGVLVLIRGVSKLIGGVSKLIHEFPILFSTARIPVISHGYILFFSGKVTDSFSVGRILSSYIN